MGEIFRAKYAGLAGFERTCAIKRILPHLSDDPEFVDRLISEAMIAVQLSHANIVQIYELGKIENEYFIAMEWVDGPDLSTLQVRAKAKDVPWPLPLAIHVVHEIARAVDHAHRKTDGDGKNLQIVHRDISPQNVMLTLDGAAKLGDFGIARAGGIARRFVTGMGAVLGKRRYMSPEQRRGENVDARTDIYALGALLYEGVTGHPPEPDGPIPLMSTLAKDVPPELDALAAKALAFDPNERISTATELVEGLERVFVRMASVPGAVRDPGPELGRFVRKICPPGEKQPQKRSLTSRIRAAMPPGAQTRKPAGGEELTENPEVNDAGETASAAMAMAPIASLELPHGADGVTLVRSAIIPAASPSPASGGDATVPRAPPLSQEDSIATPRGNAAVVPGAPSSQPTMTAAKPAPQGEDETRVDARPESDLETSRGPAPSEEPGLGASTDETATAALRSSSAETLIQPLPDLARPSRAAAASASAGSSAQTVVGPLPEVPRPDLSRASRGAANPVEVRRARESAPAVRIESGDSRTREEEIFPHAKPRSLAPLYAGAAAGLALLLLAGWAGGFLGGDPPGTAVATPIALLTPPPTRVPTRRPERTPTPRATVERTPAPEKTPKATPAKTKVAVAATPKATPRQSFGTLVVNAKPWARVSLDGRDLGQTPIKGLRLASGNYRLVLEHPTLGRVERQINLKSEATERVIVDFKNLPGEPGPGSP